MTTNHYLSEQDLPQVAASQRNIAILSLVLAAFGMLLIPALAGIAGGIYVLTRTEETYRTERTRNIAWAAIIVGAVSLVTVGFALLPH